jgi:hypothetical protein
MNMKSFFKTIGTDLLKVVKLGDEAAQVAEPVIDLMFPAEAALYNGAVAEVGKLIATGQTAAQAAAGSGTIPTIEDVADAVEPQLVAYAESVGAPAPTVDHIDAYAQSVLLGLQVLQSLQTGQAVPSSSSTVAAVAAASAVPASAAPVAAVANVPVPIAHTPAPAAA